MRPVFGSTATTAPLYFPSAASAAARTRGSSYVASSVLEESANVGTPGYLLTYLRERERVEDAAAVPGIAGAGSAKSAAKKIAILVLPDLTVPPSIRSRNRLRSTPGLPHRFHAGVEFLPQAVT